MSAFHPYQTFRRRNKISESAGTAKRTPKIPVAAMPLTAISVSNAININVDIDSNILGLQSVVWIGTRKRFSQDRVCATGGKYFFIPHDVCNIPCHAAAFGNHHHNNAVKLAAF